MKYRLKRWSAFANGRILKRHETYCTVHLQNHLMSIIGIDEFIEGGSSETITSALRLTIVSPN